MVEDRRIIKIYILPALGNMKGASVTQADVTRLHQGLRGSPYMANRVLALFSKMFNLAEMWGIDRMEPTPAAT